MRRQETTLQPLAVQTDLRQVDEEQLVLRLQPRLRQVCVPADRYVYKLHTYMFIHMFMYMYMYMHTHTHTRTHTHTQTHTQTHTHTHAHRPQPRLRQCGYGQYRCVAQRIGSCVRPATVRDNGVPRERDMHGNANAPRPKHASSDMQHATGGVPMRRCEQTDKQTNKQTNNQTNKQTNKTRLQRRAADSPAGRPPTRRRGGAARSRSGTGRWGTARPPRAEA